MPASPVKLGPFVGGVNTYSGPSAIADNEAVEILNFDIDLDGSLLTRPPITANTASMPADATGKACRVIGSYRSTSDVFYVIYEFSNTHAYAFNTSTEVWTLIQAGDFVATTQYADKLWLVIRPSGVTQGGGKWDPTAGYTAVAAMPRGYSACVYKERMFIAASRNADQTSINRVKFSNAANFDTWTGTDYFDVSSGDGQDIQKLYTFDSSIAIFKSDSTFIFAYDSQPAKGIVQIVSATIGCNNPFSLVEYENNLFVLHEDNVYRISNWSWEQANIKIPFVYANSQALTNYTGTALSVLGTRLLVRYYDKYYILGLKTGAWAVWDFTPRTNKLPNPQFDVDNSNWLIVGGQATITRDIAIFRSSPASGRLDTVINSTNPYTTSGTTSVPALEGDIWCGSAYVYGAGSSSIQVLATDGTNTLATYTSPTVVLSAAFQRISIITGALPVGTTNVRLRVRQTDTAAARTMYIDDAMLEKSNSLNTYIATSLPNTPTDFILNPNVDPVTGVSRYYAGTYAAATACWFKFSDTVVGVTGTEMFTARLITKSYDFGPSYSFKRLFFWGVDIVAGTNVRYAVNPVVYNVPVTWGQLIGVPFANLLTWGRPLNQSVDVTDNASGDSASGYRTFVKLLKSLRFRQAQFTLVTSINTTVPDDPCRVFSLTAFVDAKQVVVKKVS